MGARVMENVISLPKEKGFENLVKAYQLLYESVAARKAKEILEKMEEKENGKHQRIQNQ
jgi:hypothetical protein